MSWFCCSVESSFYFTEEKAFLIIIRNRETVDTFLQFFTVATDSGMQRSKEAREEMMHFMQSGSKAMYKKQLFTLSIWNNLISDASGTLFQVFFFFEIWTYTVSRISHLGTNGVLRVG